MARLRYTAIASLDGYVADRDGNFDWAVPDPEVHSFINSLERSVGTYLYGRRMYQVMAGWESPQMAAGQPPFIQEYAEIWRAAEKMVYSRTLETVTSARTRILRACAAHSVMSRPAGPPLSATRFVAMPMARC